MRKYEVARELKMLVCKGLENERMQRGKDWKEIEKKGRSKGMGKYEDAKGMGKCKGN